MSNARTGDLARLSEAYTWLVNDAIEHGDLARAERLSEEYVDEALRILTSGGAGQEGEAG